jgi:hypothetical protein
LSETEPMDKRIQGFETELHVCSVVRNKARVECARNFFGTTHVGDLTAVRDVGFGAKKGGKLGGGADAGVMSSHNAPKSTFSEFDRLSSRCGRRVSSSIFPSRPLGDGSLRKSDIVFAAQGAGMATKYSSLCQQITSRLETQQSNGVPNPDNGEWCLGFPRQVFLCNKQKPPFFPTTIMLRRCKLSFSSFIFDINLVFDHLRSMESLSVELIGDAKKEYKSVTLLSPRA